MSNQECQLYPRQPQQQQVPVVDFQAYLRQAFLADIPRMVKTALGHPKELIPSKKTGSTYSLKLLPQLALFVAEPASHLYL